MLVDGGEFTLRSVDTLAAHIPSANVEKRSTCEGEQDSGEGGDGKIGGIDPVSEDDKKQGDGHGDEEKRADPEP